jgi:FAD/FMN-containing dehydrogenase
MSSPVPLLVAPGDGDVPDALRGLAAELDRRGAARALDTSTLARALYSSDASLYRIVPQAVARPADVDELLAVLDAARASGIAVTTRGAGT